MLLKKRIKLFIRKKTKNKLLKTLIGTDEKYRDKVENALLYLPKEQRENMLKVTNE